MLCKKGVLRNFTKFTGKHLCQSLFLIKLQASGLELYLKRESGTGVSCEFCEISKNTFSYRTPLVAASRDLFILMDPVITSIHSRRNQPPLSLIKVNVAYLIRETSNITLRNLLKQDLTHSSNTL